MPLNEDERQLRLTAIAEAKARGLILPETKASRSKREWPLSANGYVIKMDGSTYNPTPEHKDFIECDFRYVAIFGGRGSGKSAAGAQKALKKIQAGESGAVLNPNFELFKYSTWPEFRAWIPWDKVVPSQRYRREPEWEPHKPFTMVFDNGARVFCKGLKDPDSARGPNINWLWYDEGGADLTGMGWKLATASVRVGNMPQAWLTTTPRGRDHWAYRMFILREFPAEVVEEMEKSGRGLVHYVRCTIGQNKANLDATFYASMLATYPEGWLREQELNGEFVDEGGILGNPQWFEGVHTINQVPEDVHLKAVVRYWDLAASEKKLTGKVKGDDPDETVGTLLGWDGQNFYIMDQVGGFWEYDKIKEAISLTAERDGPLVAIYIEQEPGSGGKNQVTDIAKYEPLKNFTVRAHKPEGDKVLRANVWFGEAAQGRFFMLRGPWNDKFLNQLSSFPIARHDDRIDSVSGARLTVAPIRRWKQVEFLSI